MFSNYVLKNISGLYNVDYANQIYTGRRRVGKKLIFKEKGYIYGPIRISANDGVPESRMLIAPTTEHDFIEDKVALFFVRDPRDILVSSYYSFGSTHGFSCVPEIREMQQKRREEIQKKTLDEFALSAVDRQIELFKKLHNLSNVCKRGIILKYEDMVDNFDIFSERLRRYVAIEDDVIRELYCRSRPKQIEDKSSHRRSGQVQGFRTKLKTVTIENLNMRLEDTLALFGYER
ncbi:MAG: hypothetical protein AAFP20_08500 [Cyanobacteria bacterium J06614_10]